MVLATTRMDWGQTIPWVDSAETIGQAVDHQSWVVRCGNSVETIKQSKD